MNVIGSAFRGAAQHIKNEVVRSRVMSILATLPQYHVIKSRAEAWLDDVLRIDPLRAEWHAMRLRGFGGSEIGVLCANHLGEFMREASAKEIVKSKLLLALPQLPDSEIRRRIVMEPIHRTAFHEKYGCTVDESGMEVLASASGPARWMRYSPDDLVHMPSGERVLCHYEAPSEPHNGRVYTALAADLSLGRIIAEHNGIQVGRAVLSEFSWQQWDSVEHVIERDAEMDSLIMEAGERYWANVLAGEVPEFVERNRTHHFAGADLSSLEEVARRFEASKLLAESALEHVDTIRAELKDELIAKGVGAGEAEIGRVGVRVSEVLDVDRAAQALGAAAAPARGQRYNPEKLAQMVRELGGDPDAAAEPCWDAAMLRRILDDEAHAELLESVVTTDAEVDLGSRYKDIHLALKGNCRALVEEHAEAMLDSIEDEVARVVEGGGSGDFPPAPKHKTMKVAA